jgi:hypothetical protein
MSSGNTLVVFTPLAAEPPASGYATFDTRNMHPVLDFDDAIGQSAVFSAVLPDYYRGCGLTVVLEWSATSAALTWTHAGDSGGALSGWTVGGAGVPNTDQWRLYWSLTVEGDSAVVSLYKAAGKSPADLVARGSVSHAAGGPCTLTPQNGSGLSASVTVTANAPADADDGNTLSANRVKWSVAVERLEPDGTSLGSDSFAAAGSVCAAPTAENGRLRYTEIVLADGPPIDNLAVGESFRLKVTRAAGDAGDTMTGDAELCFVVVRET